MKAKTHKQGTPDSIAFRPGIRIRSIVCCGIIGMLAGCTTGPDSYVLSAPPPPDPVTTTTTTTTTGQPGSPGTSTVVVTSAPPVVQQEAVTPQPSSEHVWIAGYWSWRDERYVWIAGHWELPPSYAVAWVPPHWRAEGGGYRFYEGYWR